MWLPDFDGVRGRVLAVLGCAIVGLAAGWMFTRLPESDSVRSSPDVWTLPDNAALSRFSDDEFQKLMARRAKVFPSTRIAKRKGGSGQGGSRETPAWRLVGTVTTPVPAALVLVRGSPEVTRLAEGQAFEDVGRVVKVGSEGISLEQDGCTVSVRLFQTSRDAADNSCATNTSKSTAPFGAGDK